jgi:mobilization protein NikA
MKTAQLQIRVTAAEKARIERAARQAGLGMSAYVLGKVLPGRAAKWRDLVQDIANSEDKRIALATLSSWLANLGAGELVDAVEAPLPAGMSEYHANTVASMVEHVCAASGVRPPAWTRDIPPLAHPVFGSELTSLRLHLLANSPAAFRRRNLFVDTAVGGQI